MKINIQDIKMKKSYKINKITHILNKKRSIFYFLLCIILLSTLLWSFNLDKPINDDMLVYSQLTNDRHGP